MNNGGHAFPRTGYSDINNPQYGMSLRDWFAGHIINGFAANNLDVDYLSKDQIAEEAYAWADALLKVRERKTK